ncbi:ROK family transcriptional regulator [Mycetocola tolaasinivorans]|uniref:ROK family transcriptional regulator n=1 Tax=Mycetocola tolaasinivorans TaxID=76635 RepID=A0A3L7A6L3_9MICO|nr:ROK family transcriptional regulator [Mycetocola tolaasinivorans]RLP75490.1 ROK family transcriptional regulator [Mycetocola tolaasinivorans]
MTQGVDTDRNVATGRVPRSGTAVRGLRPTAKALPEHARSHNRSLVLQQLYRTEGLSRADIARSTGLTRVTISDLVAELIGEGLIAELGQREAARPGKPATLLSLNVNAFHLIGMDLSDKVAFHAARFDLSGAIIERASHPRGSAVGDDALEIVYSLVDGLIADRSAPILGIGVGSPGVVDGNGRIRTAPNLGWHDLPLRDLLEARFALPVTVANDANTAVLAEHAFGSQNAANDLILIQIGAGVGAGLIVDGVPVSGSRAAAGEIGHVVVGTDGGPRCACGKDGCVEAWVAAGRLAEQLESAATPAEAQALLAAAGERLGIALAPVVGVLNLAEIVLSGPTELLEGAFATAVLETIRQRTISDIHAELTLRMTALGQDIVLRGAAVLVLSGQLGVS